jgi:hypothetical protein
MLDNLIGECKLHATPLCVVYERVNTPYHSPPLPSYIQTHPLQMGRGCAAACILDTLVDAYALPPTALLHGCGRPGGVWSSPPGNSGSINCGSTKAPELSLLHHVAAFGSPDAARAR